VTEAAPEPAAAHDVGALRTASVGQAGADLLAAANASMAPGDFTLAMTAL
jgi:hypothetical protein